MRQGRRDRAHRGQNRRGNDTQSCDTQGNFHESGAMIVLDDDPAHIPFVYQFLHFFDQILRLDLDLFENAADVLHYIFPISSLIFAASSLLGLAPSANCSSCLARTLSPF